MGVAECDSWCGSSCVRVAVSGSHYGSRGVVVTVWLMRSGSPNAIIAVSRSVRGLI